MAVSATPITRLGLSGTPRGLYGSFVGKETGQETTLPTSGMLAARQVRRTMRRYRGGRR